MQKLAAWLAVAAIAAGIVVGALRVVELERGELEVVGDPVTLSPTDGAPHRELGRATLERGDHVTFEVCARDPLLPGAWADALELVVFHPADQEVVVRTPVTRDVLEGASRNAQAACIVVARGEDLPTGGVFTVEAVWDGRTLPREARETRFQAHILAHRPLAGGDGWPVVLVLLGALVAAVSVTRWRPVPVEAVRPEAREVASRVGGALVVFLVAFVAAAFVPLGGSTVGLARGLFLAAVQVALALALVRASRGQALGALALVKPARALWALFVAPLFGLALWLLGGFALRLVPSTAEAPIETFVSWPSGTLALALVAVVVPLAEEIFFRGLVFGTVAARLGNPAAFAVTVALFALAHLPQDWGAWGALAATALTGVGLTALRWWTGSALVPMIAHLAHNAAIVALALLP